VKTAEAVEAKATANKLASNAKTQTTLQERLRFAKGRLMNVATCNLNQWAMDFEGNKNRIIKSIEEAKKKGCTYRLGPELETTGYSCEDHFYENDTIDLSWMVLKEIIEAAPPDIVCDIGIPVIHHDVRYNCRVYFLKRDGKPEILLLRPKMWMADDGNYRENRYFTPWSKQKIGVKEDYVLPEAIQGLLGGQRTAPFGVCILEGNDATIGSEICEELFTGESMNILLGFEGVDVISNGSASHFQVGKRARRHKLISEAMRKNGGVYMYANQLGCDGERLVFDGNGCIYVNDKLVATGEHLSYMDVEVVTATVDLDEVKNGRTASVSHELQSDQRDHTLHRIHVDFNFCQQKADVVTMTTSEIPLKQYEMVEEMGDSVARYLFDYMSRSGAVGYFLPLSGGVDSGSTAMLVYYMCDKIVGILMGSDQELIKVVKQRFNPPGSKAYEIRFKALIDGIDNKSDRKQKTQELVNMILHTCNMPTKNNTGKIMVYASKLAIGLGSYHMTAPINDPFIAIKKIAGNVVFGPELEYKEGEGVRRDEVYDKKVLFKAGQAGGSQTEQSSSSTSSSAPSSSSSSSPAPTVHQDSDFERYRGNQKVPQSVADLPTILDIPRYSLRGGTWQENLSIQNIQARLRMVTAYYLAQILPEQRWGVLEGKENWVTYAKDRDAAISKYYEDNKGKPDLLPYEDANFVDKLQGKGADLYRTMVSGYYKDGRKIGATRPGQAGFLLVLSSSNSDEALRGFYTKYDAASADINPIGAFSKHDLRQFLLWCCTERFVEPGKAVYKSIIDHKDFTIDELPEPKDTNLVLQGPTLQITIPGMNIQIPPEPFQVLYEILTVTASPELIPVEKQFEEQPKVSSGIQDDEVAIGMSYADLYKLGIMRKRDRLGPIGMYKAMLKEYMGGPITVINETAEKPEDRKKVEWATPTKIAQKLKVFWKNYGIHRNKMTILTPGIHTTNYSPDDNRFDLRPFLYPNMDFSYQIKVVEAMAARDEANAKSGTNEVLAAKMNPKQGGSRFRITRRKVVGVKSKQTRHSKK